MDPFRIELFEAIKAIQRRRGEPVATRLLELECPVMLSNGGIRYHLREMERVGVIKRTGRTRGTRWEVPPVVQLPLL